MRITDILGTDIQQAELGEDLFEEFVGLLLRHEQGQRHPTGEVIGPGRTKANDGGRDVVVSVKETPTTPRAAYAESLTWDEAGRTWYSSKSGRSWRGGVDKDLKLKAVRAAYKSDKDEPGPRTRRPRRDVLSHVARGHRYVVVTDQRTSDSQRGKLVYDLSMAFDFWLRAEQMSVPPALAQQIALIDGNRLAAYLRAHRPRLPAKLREPLGVHDAPGLESWEQWGREFEQGRGMPRFVPDQHREDTGARIRALVGENRVVRVVGPPGVGKTRVVYETLSALPDPSATVVYTSNPDDGHRAIEGGWLADTHGVVLVIDEVRSSDVVRAASHFRASARASLLVLVGTVDADPIELPSPGIDVIELDRLEPGASRTLIATALGVTPNSPDQRLASILHLAEGYPLFMVLLARALSDDHDPFEDGRDETSRWEAAKRVIAGAKRDYGDDHCAWDRAAELRAKCLLVVILTGHIDLSWDALWERWGARLHEALDEPQDWPQIKRAEALCVERGLLRRLDSGRHYRYVSPNNLVRIILNRFFGPPDGLGPRFFRCLPELRGRALEVARQVEARPALRRLARAECVELQRRYAEGSLEELTTWVGSGKALHLAALVLPREAAQSLCAVLLGWEDEQFEAAEDIRAAVRLTLEHLVHRRLDAAVFAEVEAALLRSARSEFEPWGNNSTAIWQSLFLPVLSQTHRPWEERLSLLRSRLEDPSPDVRALAVGALEAAAGVSETGLGHTKEDQIDGRWPVPTHDQVRAMKIEAWTRLLSMAADPAEPVATAARKAITENLRGAVVDGLLSSADGIREVLVARVREWSRAQKTALLAEIAEIQAWHTLPDQGALLLNAVDAALAPTDFGERLSRQVGDWYPGGWTDDPARRRELDERGDLRLVDEALESPALLLDELSWLVSDDAVRRSYFMKHVGMRDRSGVFLPALEEHALRADTSLLLVPYVVGRAEVEAAVLERWLERHHDDPRFDRIVAEVLVWSDLDDRRIDRLRDVIRRTPIPAPVLLPLAFRLDRSRATPGGVLSLVDDLSLQETTVEAGLPLIAHVLSRSDLEPKLQQRAVRLAETLLRSVEASGGVRSATVEVAWETTVKALADEGHIVAAIDAAMGGVLRGAGSARAEQLVGWLIDRGHAEELWAKVSALLDEGRGFELQWTLRRLKLTAALDPRLVLEWVGASEARARTIARLSTLNAEVLDPIAREILLRFGPDGRAARELVEIALSAPSSASRRDDFHAEQRSRAQHWSEDPDPRVRRWASRVTAALDHILEDDRIEPEARRRSVG